MMPGFEGRNSNGPGCMPVWLQLAVQGGGKNANNDGRW